MHTTEPPTAQSTRLLLLSDDEYLRLGLQALLERTSSLHLVDEATTVPQALRLIEALQPDLVLIEGSGFEHQGLSACSAIIARLPRTRILLWSTTPLPAAQVVQAGALGCVPRRVSARDLIHAIHLTAVGQRLPNEEQASPAPGAAASILERLSRQERRLLTLLAEGLINRDIARALGLSEKTIKNYLTSIYVKLGISRRTEAVRLMTQLYQTGSAPLELVRSTDAKPLAHGESRPAISAVSGQR